MNGGAILIMTVIEKLLKKFLMFPADFSYADLAKLLRHFGFREETGGKTTGSSVHFIDANGNSISIHKPHHGSSIKKPYLKGIARSLQKWGYLS